MNVWDTGTFKVIKHFKLKRDVLWRQGDGIGDHVVSGSVASSLPDLIVGILHQVTLVEMDHVVQLGRPASYVDS